MKCLECGCDLVRDYKCPHDCEWCKDCDPDEEDDEEDDEEIT